MICVNDALELSQASVVMMAHIPQRIPELIANFTKGVALKKEQLHGLLLLVA